MPVLARAEGRFPAGQQLAGRNPRLFQPTHASQGTTDRDAHRSGPGVISIHAPLAGCDSPSWRRWGSQRRFQSTHPLRGATRAVRPDACTREDFNPRTPCGVRRQPRRRSCTTTGFQSTHPLRGATPSMSEVTITQRFQSTHPLRGATSRTALSASHA